MKSSSLIGFPTTHSSTSSSSSHRRHPSNPSSTSGPDCPASDHRGSSSIGHGPLHGVANGLLSSPHGSPHQGGTAAAGAVAAAGGGGLGALHGAVAAEKSRDVGGGYYAGQRGGSSGSRGGDAGGDGVAVHWQQVLKVSWGYCGALFLVCMVTLSIFPGFLAEDVQVGPGGGVVYRGKRGGQRNGRGGGQMLMVVGY